MEADVGSEEGGGGGRGGEGKSGMSTVITMVWETAMSWTMDWTIVDGRKERIK